MIHSPRATTSSREHPLAAGHCSPRSRPIALPCVLLFLASLLPVGNARAESPRMALPADPVLLALIDESLTARPELARARAMARANQERVPQARAMPDPMIQLGIQNDGFSSIEIGRMDTSFVSLMVAQTFPWPGKLALQGKIAELDVKEVGSGAARVRLSTEAEVRRAYLDLLLVRDRLALLTELDAIWQTALALARSRYETGAGSQSDILRAELEIQRRKQRRVALAAEETARIQALNRLRAHRLDEPIPTEIGLKNLPALAPFAALFSEQRSLAASPELALARLGVARAGEASALAARSYYPDLTVAAGIMYRGALPPMWQVTLGAPVPVFAGSKQNRAVAESRERARAAEDEVAAIEQLIRLRSGERHTAFSATFEALAIYDRGLLVQSETTVRSTLAQYVTGKVTFASVLEANAGYLADQEAYLELLAQAQRLLILEAEVSLAQTPMLASSGGGAMPGTGAMGTAPSTPAGGGGTSGSDGPGASTSAM